MVALALAMTACSGGDEGTVPDGSGSTIAPDTTPAAAAPDEPDTVGPGSTRAKLTRVATMEQPVALAVRPDDDALYIAEKTGRVRALRANGDGPGGNRVVDPQPVLDLRSRISRGGEQGLLGLAFSPDGSKLYVNFTDAAGDTNVVEFGFTAGGVDPASERRVLFVDQPFANHNGGNLVFGPDGRLWIGLGDGGSQGDPDDNAQSLDALLGKMLRIDPAPSGDQPYTVPPDNPFVGRAGARPEIWAIGLRNPWRYSFDRATGDLWIGDVGAGEREEIDFAPAGSRGGENYGWDRLEGTRRQSGEAPRGAVAPVTENRHSDGNCSMTGGYVYRGTRLPGLVGTYLYGDFCVGQIQALTLVDGEATNERELGLEVSSLSSFGQDGAGDLYALSLEGPVYRFDPE